MTEKKKKNIILLVFLLIIAIRFINITMPILEGTATRQVQTASIARNFFREGINIFYPKVDHFGNEPGYLVLDFPLMNALAAYGYMLLGGVQEWVGRFLSILFFAGAAYFLFGITKRILGRDIAFWALLVFGLSPLSIIFSRTFMPDFETLFLGMGALYFFILFCAEARFSRFWLSAVFLSFALLVKPHSFYILIPLLYLVWKRQGWRFIIDYKNWIYLGIVFIPTVLWYRHGSVVHTTFTSEEAYNFLLSNWFNPALLIDRSLYIELIKIYAGILLTPIGLTLFIGGLFIKTKGEENLVWAWLAGGIVFTVGFITHMWEPYYHLNLLPVASILIARSIIHVKYVNWEKFHLSYRKVCIILIILFIPFFLRYAAYAYVVPKGYRYIPEAGKRIQELSAKEDLIIASAAGGPQGLYFCDRKGWSFLLPVTGKPETERAIERLGQLREKGAVFFIACVMDDFNNSPAFKEYMFKNYKLIEHKPDKYIIFSLDK